MTTHSTHKKPPCWRPVAVASLLVCAQLPASLSAAEPRDLPELPLAKLQFVDEAIEPASSESVQPMAKLVSPPRRGPGTEVFYDLALRYVDGELFNPSTQQYDTTRLRALTGSVTSKAVPYIGPVVELYPGETFRLTLNNNLPADDPSCPGTSADGNGGHCFNTTNMHTHGLWISPAGNSDNVLLRIQPDVSFQYEYNIPVDHPAGTFWYHPHVHGSTALQVSSGMAGPLIIRGNRYPRPADGQIESGDLDTLLVKVNAPAPNPIEERTLVFQQIGYACRKPGDQPNALGPILKDKDGNWICDKNSPHESERVGQIESYDQFGVGATTSVWNASGRYTSINGVVMPTFRQARAGDLERWRLIHAGVRDTINLQLRKARAGATEALYQPGSLDARADRVDEFCDGATLPQFSVASDGLTRAKIASQDKTLLQPGYREDLLMVFPAPGIYCVIDSDVTADQTVNTQAHSRELLGYVEVLPALESSSAAMETLASLEGRSLTDALRDWVRDWLVASALKFMPDDVKDAVVTDLENGLRLTAFVDHPSIEAAEVTGSQSLGFNIDTSANPTSFEIGNLEHDPATGLYSLQDASPYSANKVNRVLRLGGVDEWTLTSFLAGHPFHIHVNPFQVVSIQQCTQSNCTDPASWVDLTADPTSQYYGLQGRWRDTLFVQSGVVIKTRTRYQRYIGEYVLHCHILDHEDAGMMQNVMVALPDGKGGTTTQGHH
ncbi:multicopper oxidase family protein [Marinobacterium rhizophilum]|uniref:multicopper oxidase family protein n=1 Tax=Marinobacterium rhizophilum TaxID=420402 RepID=UPI00037151B4|nr:multicopper oxidase domain-containing protein [Marinobacterium rhizophilum]